MGTPTWNDETLSTLRQLSREIPDFQEANGLLMLLGNGLAEAMTGMRARQATLEAVRAEARGSVLAADRRAEADSAFAAAAVVRSEIRRLRIREPGTGARVTSVYGHVLDDGEPVAGALVALSDRDNALVCIETDERGGFALSADSEGPLGLRVTVGGVVVYRDEEPGIVPAPVPPYRLVELGDKEAPPPVQRPCDEPGNVSEPRRGGSLIRVLRELSARDVRVATVRLSASDDATPWVSEIRGGGDGHELDVRGRVTDAGRLAVVAALLAFQPEAQTAGIGSPTAAAALLKAGQVTTWEGAQQAARLTIDALAQQFVLDRGHAAALRTALATTLAAIDVVDER